MRLLKLCLSFFAFCLLTASSSDAAEKRLSLMDYSRLELAKKRLAVDDEKLQPALQKLVQDADKALQAGPFSVMQKKLVPPSGDKHDYISLGPYWWPDPAKPDGLPYIRRDGETNPESANSDTDRPTLEKMKSAVETLSLAYYFTGKQEYASHSAKLLRTWFLDADTKMNPHLDYGQSIPGVSKGRGIGIIDTRNLPEMLDAVALLETSPSWTKADQDGLKAWFAAYLNWLLTSKNGKDEAKEHNNHGTWYDVQVAGLALYVDKPEIAKEAVERAKMRLAQHIKPDGSQPHELARTKSFSYSLMNLDGFLKLAAMGANVGVDLWNFKTEDGRSLRAALDYLAPYADPQKAWPHKQIGGASYGSSLLPLLRRASIVYGDAKYEALVQKIPARDVATNRAQLLYYR